MKRSADATSISLGFCVWHMSASQRTLCPVVMVMIHTVLQRPLIVMLPHNGAQAQMG